MRALGATTMPGYDSLMEHRCKTGSPCADSATTRQAPSGAWLRVQIPLNQAALTFLRRGAGLPRNPGTIPIARAANCGRPLRTDRVAAAGGGPSVSGQRHLDRRANAGVRRRSGDRGPSLRQRPRVGPNRPGRFGPLNVARRQSPPEPALPPTGGKTRSPSTVWAESVVMKPDSKAALAAPCSGSAPGRIRRPPFPSRDR